MSAPALQSLLDRCSSTSEKGLVIEAFNLGLETAAAHLESLAEIEESVSDGMSERVRNASSAKAYWLGWDARDLRRKKLEA